jgi:hypothetical protein
VCVCAPFSAIWYLFWAIFLLFLYNSPSISTAALLALSLVAALLPCGGYFAVICSWECTQEVEPVGLGQSLLVLHERDLENNLN